MIAAWMFYCSLCALGLTLTGVVAERLLLAGRAPVRFVWIAALLLSVGVPAIAFRFSSSPVAPVAAILPAADAATHALPTIAEASIASIGIAPAAAASTPQPSHDWRITLPRLDEPLIVAWIALSLALAVNFIAGVAALGWMRRGWKQQRVDGAAVYVSQRTGPAVVGALSPVIVVPEWALALAPHQMALMLRHEQEHLRARDGQLLIAAQLALIAMPWNVALWWQILSLRVAIEMDCDARVLRQADARSYGELLLEVARPHRSFNLTGMIAFAERATQLERRIRVLKRHRVATPRRAAMAASTIAALALTLAAIAPHPPTPLHASPALAIATRESKQPAFVLRDSTPATAVISSLERAAAMPTRPARRLATRLPVLVACDNDTSIVGATYRALFDGISLTRDNESKACELLTRLADEQLAEDAVAQASAMAARNARMSIQSNRNAGLASLLATDADRAHFAQNDTRQTTLLARGGGGGRIGAAIAPPGGERGERGARGGVATYTGDTLYIANGMRSPSAMTDSLLVELKQRVEALTRSTGGGGRAGMNIRTDSGGGVMTRRVSVDTAGTDPVRLDILATRAEKLNVELAQNSVESVYRRLFDGITLSPDAEQRARLIIGDAQEQLSSVELPIRPGTRLRLNQARGRVAIVAGADTALIDLASNPADREKLRSRIVSVPQ